MTAAGLGIRTAGAQVSISSPDESNKTIGTIDAALLKVTRQRADLGAYQNRMENVVRGVAVAAENTQAAESRIRDTDMAEEMVDYVKNQILVQSGTAMLAQANLLPQSVLELLR
jgi:flagellin